MTKQFKLFIAGAAILAGLVSAVSCQDLSKDIEGLQSQINDLKTQVASLQEGIGKGFRILSIDAISGEPGGWVIKTDEPKEYYVYNGKDGNTPTVENYKWEIKDGYWYLNGVNQNIKATGDKGNDGKDSHPDYYVPNPETGNFDVYKWNESKKAYESSDSGISYRAPQEGGEDTGIVIVWDEERGTLTIEGAEEEPIEISLKNDLKSLAFVPDVIHDGMGVIDFLGIWGWPLDPDDILEAVQDQDLRPFTPIDALAAYRVNPSNADVSKYQYEFITRNVKTRTAYGDDFIIGVEDIFQYGSALYFQIWPASEWIEGFRELYYGSLELWNDTWYDPRGRDIIDWTYWRSQYNNGNNPVGNTYNWTHVDDPNIHDYNNRVDLIALMAYDDDFNEIVSDYAQADYAEMDRFYILNRPRADRVEAVADVIGTMYPYTPNDVVWGTNDRNIPTGIMTEPELSDEAEDVVPLNGDVDFMFRYDDNLDLNTKVYTWARGINKLVESMLGVDLRYEFALPTEYIGNDGMTNQQKFVTLKDGVLSLNREFLPENGRAAVGRTPVVKVQAIVTNAADVELLLAEAYIKFEITNDDIIADEPLPDFEYVVGSKTFEYEDLDEFSWDPADYSNDSKFVIGWPEMNQEVLNKIETALHTTPGISFDEFMANYGWTTAGYELLYPQIYEDGDAFVPYWEYDTVGNGNYPDDYETNGIIYSKTWEQFGTDTEVAGIFFSKNFDIENGQTISGTTKLRILSDNTFKVPNIVLVYNWTVKHEHSWPVINEDYLLDEESDVYPGLPVVQVKGRPVNNELVFSSDIREHFRSEASDNDYLDNWTDGNNHEDMSFELLPYKGIDQDIYAQIVDSDNPATAAVTYKKMIRMIQALNGDHKDVVVTVVDTLQNSPFFEYDAAADDYVMVVNPANTVNAGDQYYARCTMNYVVRFKNPFTVVLTNVSLTDDTHPQTEDLDKHVTIMEGANKIWYYDSNAGGPAVGARAAEYGLTLANIVVGYVLDAPAFYNTNGQTLFISDGDEDNPQEADSHFITWWNMGTLLTKDKVGDWYPTIDLNNWATFNIDENDDPVKEKFATVTVKKQ